MRNKLIFTVLLLMTSVALADPIDINVEKMPKVKHFVQKMVKKHHFDKAKLTALFNQAKILPSVIETMNRPYEAQPWYKYRASFVNKRRANAGVTFWQQHEKTLTAVEKEYGVPASVIIAIIGVETYYGRHAGNRPVINTLSTFAFRYPRREKFFSKELEHFLLFTQEQHLDPLKVKGSYAGAIGWPQFMPSSYRIYAVDYDKNGNADLTDDVDDVIASVANYLKKHGWKTHQPVAITANVKGEAYKKLIEKKAKPVTKLEKAGITPTETIDTKLRAKFIALNPEKDQTRYWLLFKNFDAIMSYNPRIPYAMAVFQLSEKIQQEKNSS